MTAAKLGAIDLKILMQCSVTGASPSWRWPRRWVCRRRPAGCGCEKLEKAGIVSGYHARIAMHLIVPIATVLMEVTLASRRQADFDRFERTIRDILEIVAC